MLGVVSLGVGDYQWKVRGVVKRCDPVNGWNEAIVLPVRCQFGCVHFQQVIYSGIHNIMACITRGNNLAGQLVLFSTVKIKHGPTDIFGPLVL